MPGTYRVWYARPTPGWGGSMVGPVFHIEAADAEHAKDEYIKKADLAAWEAHWESLETKAETGVEYANWYQYLHVKEVASRVPWAVHRGGKGKDPDEGAGGV
jgi:hypothetical protein